MSPDAIGPLLAMQNATNADDAHNLALLAVHRGATGAEAQAAIDEWVQLQGRQVQQLFAEQPRRPACCTGINRDHRCWCGRPVPATSLDGLGCAEHDYPTSIPARFDERYDPSPEPIDRKTR